MNVEQLIKAANLKPLALPAPEREINGAYFGDLLSWVMGRANEDNAWVTIMSNSNIVAVATLADTSCIILAEGVIPEDEVIKSARTRGVNLLSSDEGSYEIAKALASLGI